jgi:hypothetical protein
MTDPVTLVDAHVHLHPFVDPEAVLDAAALNFEAAACHTGSWQGVLLLAEMSGIDAFEKLRQRAVSGPVGSWKLRISDAETTSLTAERGEERIVVVAGRQIATRERLEVLALATRERLADQQDFTSTLVSAKRASALVVLPWAVGKWLGRRGRLIEEAIETEAQVFVGDNGGRPWFWSPKVFRRVAQLSRPILPGSDPLAIRGEERRIGSRGFALAGRLSTERPAASLVERLASLKAEDIRPYGKQERAWRFFRNQLRLRLDGGRLSGERVVPS